MSRTLLSSDDKSVISNLLDQAECYILVLGEFYPFGALLTNGVVAPFSIHNGSNYPNIEELIMEYDKFVAERRLKKDFELLGVAIEILLNGKDGMLIKLFSQADLKEITVFYTIKEGAVDFEF
jgi:hypothetical protein